MLGDNLWLPHGYVWLTNTLVNIVWLLETFVFVSDNLQLEKSNTLGLAKLGRKETAAKRSAWT